MADKPIEAKHDQSFFSPYNNTNIKYFNELFSYLNLAEEKYRNYDPNKANRIIELREGIEKYKDFEGVQGVIQVLTEFAQE